MAQIVQYNNYLYSNTIAEFLAGFVNFGNRMSTILFYTKMNSNVTMSSLRVTFVWLSIHTNVKIKL